MFKVESSEVFGKIKCPFLNDKCPFGVRNCIFSHDPSTFIKHTTDSRLSTPSMTYWKQLHGRMRLESTAIKSSILATDDEPKALPMNIQNFIKPAPGGSKISFSLREKMIMRLVRELRSAGKADASIADAAELEHSILLKSGAKVTSVYLSVAAERIKNLSTLLQAPTAAQERSELITEAALLSLLATKKQFHDYHFPREATSPADVSDLFGSLDAPKKCRRCGQEFVPSCQHAQPVDCRFHLDRQERVKGMRVYSCCHSTDASAGCSSAPFHVFEGKHQRRRGEEVLKFMKLPVMNSSALPLQYQALALDAEMFYTRGGYEASRVTLVDFFSEAAVLDCLVLPRYGPVLDYNTRYSGISAAMYEAEGSALPVLTFDQLRSRLAELIQADTILIGHSLDNDLSVLEVSVGYYGDGSIHSN